MMIRMLAIAALSPVCLLSAAAANEIADDCRAYVAENGGDASGCDCLGEAADADADLAAALSEIETPDDLEAADDATKEAIAACFPS
ncbi:MAG: hypothetical protein R3C42_02040 [Parvularculaceae bacterium]|nr:hypothetical protein [Parvularculaceae bacterium]